MAREIRHSSKKPVFITLLFISLMIFAPTLFTVAISSNLSAGCQSIFDKVKEATNVSIHHHIQNFKCVITMLKNKLINSAWRG